MPNFSRIDELTESYIAKGYFPSAVVSVFNEKETLYRAAYGENVMPDGSVMKTTVDTAFDMASCTKIATSTQILMLIEEGKLRLETRIPEVLDEIKSRPNLYARLRSVTIYQLLTHTSGILDWYPFYVQAGKDFFDVFESFIGDTKIVDGMEYSDMNFMLLGLVVEKVRQKPLAECVKDFRDFLGAKRMQYNLELEADPALSNNIAPSCYGNAIEEEMVAVRGLHFDGWRSKDKPVIGCNDGNGFYFWGGVVGHAGICADVDAYERLCRFYLKKAPESELFMRALTEQEPGRALGMQVGPNWYPQGAGHTGFTGPYFYINPEKKIGLVTLVNRLAFPTDHGTNTGDYRKDIAALINEIL